MRVTHVKTIFSYFLILLAFMAVGCFSDTEEEEEVIPPIVINETESGITVGVMPSETTLEFRGEFGCMYYCAPDIDEYAVQYPDAGTYSVLVRHNVKGIGGTYVYKDNEETKITDLTTTAVYEDTVTAGTWRRITVTQGSYYSYADYDYAIEISKK